jgi:neutral trehalase
MLEIELPTGTKAYVDIVEHPEARIIDNVLLISIRGDLEFYNAARLRRRIEMLLDVEEHLILDYDHKDGSSTPQTPTREWSALFVNATTPSNNMTIVLCCKNCTNMDSAS